MVIPLLLLLCGPLGGLLGGTAFAISDELLLSRLQVQVVEHRFDNGLRLVVQTDRRAPLVAMHLQTAAGAS